MLHNIRKKEETSKGLSFIHNNWRWDSNSDPIFSLEHDHRVATNNNHSDLLLLARLCELDGLVQHQVHEGVESSEDALNCTTSIDFQVNLKC